MSVNDVRKTLREENALLDVLIAAVDKFPKKRMTTSQSRVIHSSWKRFLQDRKATNSKQIKLGTDELRKDFELEVTQLGAFIHTIPRGCGYSEKWRKFLECERGISLNLWKKI